MTSTAPGFTPARASTSASGTPVHWALLTAPSSHWAPSTCGTRNTRPLPAHSSVAGRVCWAMPASSSTVSSNGRSTCPSTRTVNVARSTFGSGLWLRT